MLTAGLARAGMSAHACCGMTFRKILGSLLLAGFAAASSRAGESAVPAETAAGGKVKVVVIPVRDQIADPVLYVIRRGLKQAIDNGVKLVVLDMDTPGGALDTTFEILKALDRFDGETITFVNAEAISAGALISAGTDEIYFAPDGVIGAAAPVLATGQELDETMRDKIISYLKARVRSISEGKGFRGQVISAMIDSEFELKIGEEVIKPKGELLSLTATEAAREYGEPPQPLLAAGVARDVEALLKAKLGSASVEITRLEVTWSEQLAQYLTSLAPILLGVGLVLLFVEFKTPGFGVFGITGGLLLLIVFFGHYIAGFSGHEPVLLFALGLLLIGLEIFLLPGTIFLAATGGLLLLASLVWSMADLWPNEPIEFSGDVFLRPLWSVTTGVLLAAVLMLVLLRLLPRNWIWDRLVLQAAVVGTTQASAEAANVPGKVDSLLGRRGVAVTDLFPSGQVEIDGRIYDAHLALGTVKRGAAVVVTSRTDFGLEVEAATS